VYGEHICPPVPAPARETRRRSAPIRITTGLGIPELHFHDYDPRHTGGTLAATTGATLKELMARLGHPSPRVAMIYQHATKARDKTIADGLGLIARDVRKPNGHQE